MDYIIYTEDKPDSLHIRKANREDHLAWLKNPPTGMTLLSAGPWLDSEGEMKGSLVIVEGDTQEQVETWLLDDPYRKAGLTGSAIVKPYMWVIGRPES